MRRIILCLVICLSAAVGVATPAAAGPGDEDIPVDSLMELELDYFTASPRSVPAGEASTLRWRITGSTPAVIRRRPVGKTGSATVHPQARDETHTLTASALGATRTLGIIRIGVTPCETSASLSRVTPVVDGPLNPGEQIPDEPQENAPVEGQCSRPGTARFTYERIRAEYAYAGSINLSPRTGSIRLDACATDPGYHGRIEQFDWTITPAGSSPTTRRIVTDQCVTGFGPYATGNPPYTVRLRARGSDGGILEKTAVMPVKDLLVVSLGDSLASGEGNPDDPGDYVPVPIFDAAWKHSTCHRSARSGHTKAAVAIDNMDKRTGMLFMSLACSGANVDDLVSSTHKGQQPQLTELRDILCRYDCERPIDVLMLTVGINHLGFADVVKYCKVLWLGADCGDAVTAAAKNVGAVSDKLAQLRNRINALGLNVRRVVITEYPANVFDNGCALFSSSIGRVGTRLNQEIASAASSFGWGYAGGIVSGFQEHNYCASNSYFRSFTQSLDMQGDVEGTAHPNGTGHSVIATRIASRYVAMGAANAVDEGPFTDSVTTSVPIIDSMR